MPLEALNDVAETFVAVMVVPVMVVPDMAAPDTVPVAVTFPVIDWLRVKVLVAPKPGTRLVREWRDEVYLVNVQPNGYEYKGGRYKSLSQIARLITGTRWSGPLFFGINGDRAAVKEARRARNQKPQCIVPSTQRHDVLSRLERGAIDVIVQVQLLGEGADYPSLSVAAIFRPFRNLVPYVQFVGRIMRVIKQNSPGDIDNRGYVVSHVGLNVDRWWQKLKDLDGDDQGFFEELANSDRAFLLPRSTGDSTPAIRRRFMPDMVVLEETIAHYIKDRFLAEEVGAIADDVIAAVQLRGLDLTEIGITREELESRILAKSESSTAKGIVIVLEAADGMGMNGYCEACGQRMIAQAKEKLDKLIPLKLS
jgi:hypothetical protein